MTAGKESERLDAWQGGQLAAIYPIEHAVQFYEDHDFLIETATQFLAIGMARSEPLIVIATEAHLRGIRERLLASALAVDRALRSGFLTMLDARETLSKIMVGGTPGQGAFQEVIGRAVAQCNERWPGARVRAFEEMADLLWKDRMPQASIRLETCWNELRRRRPISLLCAYSISNIADEADMTLLQEAFGTHTHVMPAERYALLEDPDSRLREVAMLQQQVHVLERRILSEQKRVDDERAQMLLREQAAREEAETANRMKDEFLATLSHELRTPLNAILGWAQTLRAGGLDPDKQLRAIETIERNAKTQAQLIEDVLDVSRIIAGKLRLRMRHVDLAGVIRGAIESVQPAAEGRQVTLSSHIDPAGRSVYGDVDRLQQVVWNLLSNAIRFTPSGGRVDVTVDRTEARIRIRVQDTGMGIKPEFLPHVFDRFRQADATPSRSHGGLGLGLSIVRQLVELHGGQVTASSDGVGKGAVFEVLLPVSAVRLDTEVLIDKGNRAVASSSALSGTRILLVDDEPDARELLKVVLERHGAMIRAVGSAAEALKMVQEWGPHVLVSDIGLPGEDGYELIRKVRTLPIEQSGWVPAVALTAYASTEDARHAMMAGYQMHIRKPVEPLRLVQVIAELTHWTQAPGDRA